jgi:hypothetical protein
MGYSVKGSARLGSRGLGKALHLLAGNRTVTRTTLPDGRSAASEWKYEPTTDWQWRLAPDLGQTLASPGVQIETYGIIDSVHATFTDSDAVLAELQERWFRLLEDGAVIEYSLLRAGKSVTRRVEPPSSPPLDDSHGIKSATQEHPKVIVHLHDKRLGEVRNVKLCLARDPFQADDPRKGIAIVKNGKQTITRFSEFPVEIPEDIRRRVFGHCDVICTDEAPFVKDAENSTHTGYRRNHESYKALVRELRKLVRVFVEPFMRTGTEKITDKEAREAQEILSVLNKALEQIPDLNLFGRGPPEPPEPKEKPTHVFIGSIELENRSHARGEAVPIRVVVKNPTSSEQVIRVVVEHSDTTPVVVGSFETAIIIPPAPNEAVASAELDWSCPIDPSLARGIHTIQVSLRDTNKEPIRNKDGKQIIKRHWLYVETTPPDIARTRKSQRGDQPDTPRNGFNNFQFFRKPELAETYEAHIDPSQGAAFVNIAGRRFDYFRKNSASKRSCWPVVGEVVGEKLVAHVLESKLGDRDSWAPEEVRTLVQSLDESRAKLVRTMIQLVGSKGQSNDTGAQPSTEDGASARAPQGQETG